MVDFIYRVNENGVSELSVFSIEHIIAIIVSLLIMVLFYLYSPKLKGNKIEPIIRYTLATYMVLTSLYLLLYRIDMNYPWYRFIPEGTCAYGTLLGAFTLITKNRKTFILAFFYGWGGFASIFFPNIAEGITRYYFYQFYLRHIFIVLSALYMIRVFDYKIFKKDYKLYFIVTLPLAFMALGISTVVNKPDEFNMLYMMQPAVSGTPLDAVYDIHHIVYIIVWLAIGISFAYIYGIPFYSKQTKDVSLDMD